VTEKLEEEESWKGEGEYEDREVRREESSWCAGADRFLGVRRKEVKWLERTREEEIYS
jgi:hypothetical protein